MSGMFCQGQGKNSWMDNFTSIHWLIIPTQSIKIDPKLLIYRSQPQQQMLMPPAPISDSEPEEEHSDQEIEGRNEDEWFDEQYCEGEMPEDEYYSDQELEGLDGEELYSDQEIEEKTDDESEPDDCDVEDDPEVDSLVPIIVPKSDKTMPSIMSPPLTGASLQPVQKLSMLRNRQNDCSLTAQKPQSGHLWLLKKPQGVLSFPTQKQHNGISLLMENHLQLQTSALKLTCSARCSKVDDWLYLRVDILVVLTTTSYPDVIAGWKMERTRFWQSQITCLMNAYVAFTTFENSSEEYLQLTETAYLVVSSATAGDGCNDGETTSALVESKTTVSTVVSSLSVDHSYQLQASGEDLRTTPSISPEECCQLIVQFLHLMRETSPYKAKPAPSTDSLLEVEVGLLPQVHADEKRATENVVFGRQEVARIKEAEGDGGTLRSEAEDNTHSTVSPMMVQSTRSPPSYVNLAKDEKLQPRSEGSLNSLTLLIFVLLITACRVYHCIPGPTQIEFPSAQTVEEIHYPVIAQVRQPGVYVNGTGDVGIQELQCSVNEKGYETIADLNVHDRTTQMAVKASNSAIEHGQKQATCLSKHYWIHLELSLLLSCQVVIPAKQIRYIERSAVHSVQHSRNNNPFFDTTEVYDKTTQDPAVEPTQLSESSCTQPKSTLARILLGRSAEWQWTQKFKVTLEKPRIVSNDDENETSLLEIAAQDLGSEMELNPERKCRNVAFTKSTADVEVDIIPNGNRRGCLKCPDSGGDRTGSDEGERSDRSGSNGATASNEVSNVERHPSSGLGAGGSAGGGGDDRDRDEKYYWSSPPEDGDDEAKPQIIVVLQFTVQDESPKKLILSGLQQIFLDPRERREWQEEIPYWFNRRNYSFTHMTRREARLHINHWPPHLFPSVVCTIDELQISEEFTVTLSSAISHLPLNRNDRRSADHNVPHQLPRLPVYQNPTGQTNLIFAIYPPPPCNNNRPATAALLGHPDRSPANLGMQLNLRQENFLTDRTPNMTRQLSLPQNSPRNSRATRLRDVDRGIDEAFRRLNLTEPSHLLPSAASDNFHPPPVATMRGRRRTQTVDSTWVISEPVDMPCRRPTETNPLIESPLPQRITPYTDHQQRAAFDHSALRERQSQTPRAQPTLPPLSESSISGSSRTPNWPHFPPCHSFTPPSKLSLSSSTSYYIQRPSRRHRALRLYNHQRHSRRRISTQHRSLRRRCHCRYHLTETEPTVTGASSKQVQEDTLPVEDKDVHGVSAEANGGEPDVAAPPILPVQEENPHVDEEPPTLQERIHHPTDY